MNRRQPIYNLYVDDSGTRNPSSKSRSNEQDRWFALGGVLVSDDHVEQVKKNHSDFCSRWSIHYPLHSVEIRHKKDNFSWLANMPQVEERRFYRDLASLMTKSPILGHACVIDRAG